MLKFLDITLGGALLALLIGITLQAQETPATTSQWQSLENLQRVGDAQWNQNGQSYQANLGKGFLVTQVPYKNFHLKVEFRSGDNTNSGIFVRCQDPQAPSDKSCYEANIFDLRPDPTYGTGTIVHHSPMKVPMETENRGWILYEVIAEGDHIQVFINGINTADLKSQVFDQGYIAFQFAGGDITFRNPEIKKL